MPNPDQVRSGQEIRRRFLNVLYDREARGENLPNVQDIAADIGLDPEDWDEIERVVRPLHDDGMIGGLSTAEISVVRASLTGAGRRFVEAAATGQPASGPASVGNVNVEGSGNVINVQQNSPGAQQSTIIEYTTGDLRRIREWLDSIDDQADRLGLSDEDTEEIRDEATALRQEMERTPRDPSRMQSIGRRLVRLIGRAAGSLATGGLAAVGRGIFE